MTIPTDAQFFSKTDKTKPDIAFLKNHFYREGRLKEEHALYIIDRATQLLRAEPNVLSVEAPVTGECAATFKSIRHLTPLSSQSAGTFTANTCVRTSSSPPSPATHIRCDHP